MAAKKASKKTPEPEPQAEADMQAVIDEAVALGILEPPLNAEQLRADNVIAVSIEDLDGAQVFVQTAAAATAGEVSEPASEDDALRPGRPVPVHLFATVGGSGMVSWTASAAHSGNGSSAGGQTAANALARLGESLVEAIARTPRETRS